MGTILSRIIVPNRERITQKELYYHSTDAVEIERGALVITQGSKVRFDTYFNAFFYPKYLYYTTISSIAICLQIKGIAQVRVLCSIPTGKEILLYEKTVSGGEYISPMFQLADFPLDGMFYFELEAVSKEMRFLSGRYETAQVPSHNVKVAAVICTYRRESYVIRNVKQLQETVWEDTVCPIREDLDALVIDNGGTLNLTENDHVRVFPNKNCGGSGGFTRGLIEAYCRRPAYSHVLFMDDDISFETETLVKTVQILRYAKQLDRSLCIGGQMLIEDAPTIQFEAGAFYRKGRLEPVNQGLDLSTPNSLLDNEMEHHVQYNAWWYCCIPLVVVEQIGLPLPLFLKTDDVEYGLRMAPQILLMNGIGIWHTAFSHKYSPHLEYYIKRNELIVSALYNIGAGVLPSLWKLIRASGKAVLIGDPRTIVFLLWGYRDFLKGPDFFLKTDGEKLNAQLLDEMKKPPKSRIHSVLTDPFRLFPMIFQMVFRYTRVRNEYKRRIQELTGVDFWCRYLEIESGDETA